MDNWTLKVNDPKTQIQNACAAAHWAGAVKLSYGVLEREQFDALVDHHAQVDD